MAGNRYIADPPPAPTGNAEADAQAMYAYLSYLQEELNYILRLLYNQMP